MAVVSRPTSSRSIVKTYVLRNNEIAALGEDTNPSHVVFTPARV